MQAPAVETRFNSAGNEVLPSLVHQVEAMQWTELDGVGSVIDASGQKIRYELSARFVFERFASLEVGKRG